MMSVPGIRPRFIDKARAIPADIICFDLEDSVAWDDKPAARRTVAEALPEFPAGARLLYVRINALDSGLAEEDLDAVVGPWLHGINMPKSHDAAVIERIDAYLTLLERTRDIPAGQIKLIPWIESAQAIARADEICTASPRLIGAAIGGEDYATDLGIQRTPEGTELAFARAVVANACAAAAIVPIDTPTTNFTDLDQCEDDVRRARQLGYRAKFCIHPTQVEIANRVFAPSEEEMAWAKRVVDAYEGGKRRGHGAVALDGVMIDDPIAERAYNLLQWVERIAEREAQPEP